MSALRDRADVVPSVPSFDPRAVYTLDQLEAMLAPAVSAKAFLERLRVPRRFKYLVLGSDIVRALENPPAESDLRSNPERPAAVVRHLADPAGPRRPRGRPRKDGTPPRRRLSMADVMPAVDSVDRRCGDGG